MTRRWLLAFCTRLLSLFSAIAVFVPGFRFLTDPLLRSGESKGRRFRLARLDELTPGVPYSFAVRGQKRDGWKVYPSQVLGRVWVIRKNEATEPGEVDLQVFSATCPHLGCTVDHDAEKQRFVCPCHGGVFELDGRPVPSDELGYSNPVPRGLDPLPWALVRDAEGGWWVEVEWVRYELGKAERIRVG